MKYKKVNRNWVGRKMTRKEAKKKTFIWNRAWKRLGERRSGKRENISILGLERKKDWEKDEVEKNKELGIKPKKEREKVEKRRNINILGTELNKKDWKKDYEL